MPQAHDLEERICRVDGSSDMLGFVKASLVWDTHGKDSSTNSDDDTGYMTKVDKNTPLISDASTRSDASLDSQQEQPDKVAFRFKDIDIRFPADGLSVIAGPTGSG
ncbi:hypothetical protein DL89DRAFT_185660 [Linderina pennispora]|uniref:Uncharacterized protein n=1 Tax=Linderina pennispora TaxID=61395 RepID=A0A1Y1VT50_9FUNG|nr:uncharacterized protein DL89DRAFT_185660 [Linderina pennispora]ORX64470.1 hypothetical protein DL89DRAFT_185660 [Linderina pennispora]